MLKFLKKNRDVEHILVEKTERLYRNFGDLVKITELERNIHFVKEGHILGPNSRSHEKFIHDIKVALAKNYIDNLSEETSKGMLEKAEQGLYPSWAPLGYVNNKETKGIDIDWTRAPIIRELFEIYSSGLVSLSKLTKTAWEKELRSRTGRKVQKNQIVRMLKNPIYIGDFMWKGVYYKGKHEPIMARELFERVQSTMKSRTWNWQHKKEFAFRGFLKCGHCGCDILPQIQKGKYVYYHCSGSKGKCPEKYIREERLAELLGEPLKRLRMTEERLQWIKQALSESFKDERRFKEEETKKLKEELKELERKIDMLYEDKLEGIVTDRFWKSKYREYMSKQGKIEERLEEHKRAGVNYLEDSNRILELAQNAYSLYLRQDSFEQRKMLNLLSSNSILKDGKVEIELRKPFDTIADGVEEEAELMAQKVPFEARNKNWLLR